MDENVHNPGYPFSNESVIKDFRRYGNCHRLLIYE
jgi:hypothetical protein